MLLIHPPVAKTCEPPAGIARLAGVLRANDLPCTLLDTNLEAQLFLLSSPPTPKDTWSKRACCNISNNLAALRSVDLYNNPDRYKRAVADINRVLEISGREHDVTLSIANYQDSKLSPLKSADLLYAADHFEDNIFYPYFAERLGHILETEQPAMVGISLNYLSQALCTFALVGFLKMNYPGLNVVLGGGLVTSWLRNTSWKNPFSGLVDHMIAGPGEKPLLALLKKKTQNAYYVPDYLGLPLSDYLAPGFILPYSASSGCYWNKCSFCPEKAEDNPYTQVPVDQVLNDIRRLSTETKPALLHLLDNAISPALMKAFEENPPGINWYGFARFSSHFADEEYCKALRKSGCVMLKLGLESGDQGVLDAMNKGIDLDLVSRVLKSLHKAGITTYIYMLFGTPAETITEARHTLNFVAEHDEAIGFLNLAIFNMPVCSDEAHSLAISEFYDGDLSIYTDFRHPHGWNRKIVRRFVDQEFKRHPAIATILRRDPPLFTSNHAPFFSTH